MSRYIAIHIHETDDGSLRVHATGLPHSNTVSYTDLSPAQQMAAQLMVHAERLRDRAPNPYPDSPTENDADAESDRQVA